MKGVLILSGGVDSTTLLYHVLDQYPKMELFCLTFNYGQKHVKEIEMAQYHTKLNKLPHIIMDMTGMTVQSVGGIPALFASSALINDEIDVPEMEDVEGDTQPPTYVPNRNMILLSLAAGYAETLGADRVFYGAQLQDMYGYWDCTVGFVGKLNRVLRLNRKAPVNIEAPFVAKSKAQIVAFGTHLNVNYGMTWSCYVGGEVACGKCPTCAERLKAFKENGLVDPIVYAMDEEE